MYYVAIILSSVYGLRWSYVAKSAAIQDVITSDMAMYGRGCGHVSMDLRFVTSANV